MTNGPETAPAFNRLHSYFPMNGLEQQELQDHARDFVVDAVLHRTAEDASDIRAEAACEVFSTFGLIDEDNIEWFSKAYSASDAEAVDADNNLPERRRIVDLAMDMSAQGNPVINALLESVVEVTKRNNRVSDQVTIITRASALLIDRFSSEG